MTENQDQAVESAETIQVVVFELHGEEYAVEISELQEIILTPEVTPLPNVPNFIGGIINLRGKMVVIVDLEKKFALESEVSKHSHIIVTQSGENTFGILVDKVTEIIKVTQEKIQPPPSVLAHKVNIDYLKGVIPIGANEGDETDSEKIPEGSRLLILLNLTKILENDEIFEIGQQLANEQTNTKEEEKN